MVGKLYAHIFSSEIVSLVNSVSLGPISIGKMARIWPLQEDFIVWPPNAMDDSDANDMASAIFLSLEERLSTSM